MKTDFPETQLEPLRFNGTISNWSSQKTLLAQIALQWNRFAPRGKGAIPRWIGRSFGEKWKMIVTTKTGCQLAVDPEHLDLFVTIENEGGWEPWVCKACILALRKVDVMYDVGANAGVISMEVATAVNGIQIKAFEPQTSLAQIAAVSVALNRLNCIELFPVAVGATTGTAQLLIPSHSVHATTISTNNAPESTTECQMVSLDDIVFSETLPPPHLIKIDIEGGEYDVLEGAQNVIKKHLPIIIFEANDNCQKSGHSQEDLMGLISSQASYTFYRISPGDILATPDNRSAEFCNDYKKV